jgi:hypothetical protein
MHLISSLDGEMSFKRLLAPQGSAGFKRFWRTSFPINGLARKCIAVWQLRVRTTQPGRLPFRQSVIVKE